MDFLITSLKELKMEDLEQKVKALEKEQKMLDLEDRFEKQLTEINQSFLTRYEKNIKDKPHEPARFLSHKRQYYEQIIALLKQYNDQKHKME